MANNKVKFHLVMLTLLTLLVAIIGFAVFWWALVVRPQGLKAICWQAATGQKTETQDNRLFINPFDSKNVVGITLVHDGELFESCLKAVGIK